MLTLVHPTFVTPNYLLPICGLPPFQVGGSHVNGAGQSPGGPLPWLVLYCGANPKVEEVRDTSALKLA